MVNNDEGLVQACFFDAPTVKGKETRRGPVARHGLGPVTRDPEVALAHEEAYRFAHSVKLGLARIVASRSEEERQALRALLAKPRVA